MLTEEQTTFSDFVSVSDQYGHIPIMWIDGMSSGKIFPYKSECKKEKLYEQEWKRKSQ